jgi:hypothetical protein
LRDANTASGSGKIQFLGHGHEISQMPELHRSQ